MREGGLDRGRNGPEARDDDECSDDQTPLKRVRKGLVDTREGEDPDYQKDGGEADHASVVSGLCAIYAAEPPSARSANGPSNNQGDDGHRVGR